MADRRDFALFVNGVAGEQSRCTGLQRDALALFPALARACGGSRPPPPPPPPPEPTPIGQATATALAGSLTQAATAVVSTSPQVALAAEAAALLLDGGVKASPVSITAGLVGGMPDRAALSSGTAAALAFQLQVLHLANSPSPLLLSGVLLFEDGSNWTLVAGPSPGASFPNPALGLLSIGGLAWQATAGQESAQLQTQSGSCGIPLRAAISSCEDATFTGAGFDISASTPVSAGATGSKTASMVTQPLAGYALIIDCSFGTLCPGSTPTATVSVGPSTVTLGPGGAQKFAATVVGTDVTNNAVTWSVDEPGGGTIDASGSYTAPSTTGTFHVRATSVAAPSSPPGTATVTVKSPSGITVGISPTTPTITVHGSILFESSVAGSGDPAVTWSVEETGGGTITSLGA